MRAGAVRVLNALLADAGPEGWCWRSPSELQSFIRRSRLREEYSLATILRSLRELQAAELITWRHVAPGGRYPARFGKGRDSKCHWGRGRVTQCGGRVFMINLDAFELPFMPAKRATTAPAEADARGETGAIAADVEATAPELQGSIMYDPPGSIIHDRSSDLLRSLSETPQSLGRDDDGSRAAAARPPSADDDAPSAREESPRASAGGSPVETGKVVSLDAFKRTREPRGGDVGALRDVGLMRIASALCEPAAPPKRKSHEGKEHDAGQASSRVTAAQMQADLEDLFARFRPPCRDTKRDESDRASDEAGPTRKDE
jgi:hypothetical protein